MVILFVDDFPFFGVVLFDRGTKINRESGGFWSKSFSQVVCFAVFNIFILGSGFFQEKYKKQIYNEEFDPGSG